MEIIIFALFIIVILGINKIVVNQNKKRRFILSLIAGLSLLSWIYFFEPSVRKSWFILFAVVIISTVYKFYKEYSAEVKHKDKEK